MEIQLAVFQVAFEREALIQFCLGPCITDPCQNGGTCTDNEDDTRTCECEANYAGDSCENKLTSTYSSWMLCGQLNAFREKVAAMHTTTVAYFFV